VSLVKQVCSHEMFLSRNAGCYSATIQHFGFLDTSRWALGALGGLTAPSAGLVTAPHGCSTSVPSEGERGALQAGTLPAQDAPCLPQSLARKGKFPKRNAALRSLLNSSVSLSVSRRFSRALSRPAELSSGGPGYCRDGRPPGDTLSQPRRPAPRLRLFHFLSGGFRGGACLARQSADAAAAAWDGGLRSVRYVSGGRWSPCCGSCCR